MVQKKKNPDTENAGVTVFLFPVPRVSHLWSTVEGIPAQFVINQHTTWIWVGGIINKQGAEFQLVPQLSHAKRTPLLVLFKKGMKLATVYAPRGVKGYLDRWKVYENTGYRYTLHVGPPQLIGSLHSMGAADLMKEVNQLELVRLEVNTGSSPKAARSELGSDMDDVDVLLDEDAWDIDDTDPTDAIDPDETVETEARDYTKEVCDAMAEAEEAITHTTCSVTTATASWQATMRTAKCPHWMSIYAQ